MPAGLDYAALATAICKGVIDGNNPLVAALAAQADKRHDLRSNVQQNADKLWELDGEMKLLKGVIVSLVGAGDGTSGSVPRLETGMNALRSEVSGLRGDVTGIKEAVDKLSQGAEEQKSWTDGWKGVGVAITLIGAGLSAIAVMIGFLVWLFQHGVKP